MASGEYKPVGLVAFMTDYERQADEFDQRQREHEQRAEAAREAEWTAMLARIKARVESPEYQHELARREMAERAEAERSRIYHYERQLERLSAEHVKYVRQHTDDDLWPRDPIPSIWEQLANEWDWVSHVFLVGPTESQKTTTMHWAAMHWACDGGTVRRTTAPRVHTLKGERLEQLRKCGLLLLDQIHLVEGMPDWQVTPVIDLIDYRYETTGTMLAAGTVNPNEMGGIIGVEVRRRFGLRLSTAGSDEDETNSNSEPSKGSEETR
jgi:hypothetical protein